MKKRIRIHTNWTSPAEIRELFNRCTINGDYTWNDLIMVNSDNPKDYDYFVIFNTPYHNFNYYDKTKAIVFCCEPISTRNIFATQYGFDPYKHKWYYFYDTPNHHNLDKWYVSLNYKQLLETNRFEKTKVISSVISNTQGLKGHEFRINFISYLDSLNDYDNFGRACPLPGMKNHRGPILNKEDGIRNYKYTFNCENTIEPGYFTEKFIDPILCETLCFYYGCPNVDKFINPDAYIKIDITKPKEALEIIKTSIANNEWKKRIECIREEKKKLMTVMNPLNIIEHIVKYRKAPYTIPA